MSQTSSQSRKRPKIEDFFKPFAQTTSTIPQKRASPSTTDSADALPRLDRAPKTPVKIVTFKEVTPSNIKSPWFSPASQSSLPIRSPKPDKVLSPSPRRQKSLYDTVPNPPLQSARTNTSFTFSDISDRSQTIVEDGKVVAVKDSDDDSDSLESLDEIFGTRRATAQKSTSSCEDEMERERIRTLNMFTCKKSTAAIGRDRLRALNEMERANKFDLAVILDDHFGDEDIENNIAKLQVGLESMEDLADNDNLDRNLLASVVRTEDTDQDDVARLLHAVERTEALATDKRFSFFKAGTRCTHRLPKTAAFPIAAIPDQVWSSKDVVARNRAYLSGYMSELAGSNDLADEAFKWTFNQVVREPQSHLRQSYVQCLKAGSPTLARVNITAADVQSLFRDLGAREDCLGDASSIEARYYPMQDDESQDLEYLISVLQVFQHICDDMDFFALSKLCSVLLRLAVDKILMADNLTAVAVENLVEKLLSLRDEESSNFILDRLLVDAREHLRDPLLQVQLLSHILPTSPTSKQLRKALADAFLLDSCTTDSEARRSGASLELLSDHLTTSPSFSLTRHSNSTAIDYAVLTAKIQILNVAVSSGNPPSISASRQPDSGALAPAEIEFNKTVDKLADQLDVMFASIKDTGASHMRRTEAKDAIQALYYRLLYSVRTRPRKKKHVFDERGEMKGGSFKGRWVSGEEWREKERAGTFIKKFLGRKDDIGI